jgi:hypothetical protein
MTDCSGECMLRCFRTVLLVLARVSSSFPAFRALLFHNYRCRLGVVALVLVLITVFTTHNAFDFSLLPLAAVVLVDAWELFLTMPGVPVGVTWTEENLFTYLENPKKFIKVHSVSPF